MLPKHLRILIADSNQQLRFTVEKLLNHAGCYGVAVVGSVDELMSLLDFGGRPFDVVLVNCHLLNQASAGALEALHKHGNVVLYRNGLYSGRMADPLALISAGLCGLPGVTPTLH